MIFAPRIAKLSPLSKLALWAALVATICLCLQAVATTVGISFSVFDKSTGGTAVILIAFGTLLAMMAVESRPMADYGLLADTHWKRKALTGLATGAGVYAAFLVFGWSLGVLTLHPDATSPLRWGKAVISGWSAPAVAVTQQMIFSGYLLTTLRDRHSRVVAVLLPALLFATAAAAATAGGFAAHDGQRLFIGMLLVQTLLGLLRLRTGSIVLPAGLLAGCILVRKVGYASRYLDVSWSHPDVWWTMPEGDPRQGAGMWVILAGGVAAAGIALWRRGETHLTADAGVDASFKRHMPFSNLFGLAPLDRWAVLLWQARLRIGFFYLPRFAVSMVGSTVTTLLALPERLIAPLLLKHEVPPPVFIVGMPRSGTTHLHNLLALDSQFRSPRNYEVFNPHGFLTGWLTTALLTPFLTWRRPMDSVQMTIYSAQEEEFALATMGSPSPYWSFCLPREIDRHDKYWFGAGFNRSERQLWSQHFTLFLRKLTCWRRRTPLLKNPANTGRVAMLAELFPGAKFIHIVRHPHAVWRSNQRLAEHGLAVFQLQTPDPNDNYATRSLANYRQLMDAYYADTKDLPSSNCADVRFEDLEADPRETIRLLYEQLGLEVSPTFAARIEAYVESVSGYRKNKFAELSQDEQQTINTAMLPYLEAWGYHVPAPPAKRAA